MFWVQEGGFGVHREFLPCQIYSKPAIGSRSSIRATEQKRKLRGRDARNELYSSYLPPLPTNIVLGYHKSRQLASLYYYLI
jgi:hypothetical protein